VLQVRDGLLQVLLWQRARDPDRGAWSLPGGVLEQGETLEASIRRHLATKVDVREVSHLEQLATYGDPRRVPAVWELATAYLGLVQLGLDPHVPDDTRWHPVDDLPRTAFDHGEIVLAGRERLRGKLSYSNAGFALAPPTFTLAELRRVLERRAVIEPTGDRRPSGRAGGRPAEVFRFRDRRLAITDPFATFRPRR
jgi:ADP-ribose pyrophosphatase YjhB (NUDIX family)